MHDTRRLICYPYGHLLLVCANLAIKGESEIYIYIYIHTYVYIYTIKSIKYIVIYMNQNMKATVPEKRQPAHPHSHVVFQTHARMTVTTIGLWDKVLCRSISQALQIARTRINNPCSKEPSGSIASWFYDGSKVGEGHRALQKASTKSPGGGGAIEPTPNLP